MTTTTATKAPKFHGIATTKDGSGPVVSFPNADHRWVRVLIDGQAYDYDVYEVEVAPVAHVAIELHICDQRRSYIVRFFGDQAGATAAKFLAGKRSTHAFADVPEEPIDFDRFPEMGEVLDPTCSHGMSANLCMGPDHFMSADQERQMFGDW